MDEQFGDELRSLRQRAYGPNADIQEDPIALERLRQLEAQAAPRRSEPGLTGAVSAAAPVELGEEYSGHTAVSPLGVGANDELSLSNSPAEGDADPVARPPDGTDGTDGIEGTPDSAEEAPSDELPAEAGRRGAIAQDPSRFRRRGALIWAGALTAALLVGATLSYVAVGLTPGSVGVLQADPDADWPDDFSPREAGSEIFEKFHGLTIVLVPQDWNGGAPSPCLFILTNESEGLIGGAGCGAGDFEPVTAITVTEQMPKALREEFPVGSSLQFQLREGEVVVFAEGP